MAYLAIIPARGGSKGIVRKNIKPISGKPLIKWTIDAAKAVPELERVIVSTDCSEIASVAYESGAEVPFIRPANIADDDATALSVIEHSLNWFKEKEQWVPDAVIYLQPTSPLRRAEHIQQAIAIFEQNLDVETIVSVMQVPHNMTPASLMHLQDGQLSFAEGGAGQKFSRHEKPVLYARNGPAILMSRTDVFKSGRLYGQSIAPLIMTFAESVDIDTVEDFEIAEALMNAQNSYKQINEGE